MTDSPRPARPPAAWPEPTVVGPSEAARQLRQHTALAARQGLALAVALLEVDGAATLAASFGPEAVEAVVAEVARRVRGAARTEDVVGRWEGERLLCVLPGTDRDRAVAFGRRITRAVTAAGAPIADGPAVPITLSIGIGAGSGPPEVLINLAGLALAAARPVAGRDPGGPGAGTVRGPGGTTLRSHRDGAAGADPVAIELPEDEDERVFDPRTMELLRLREEEEAEQQAHQVTARVVVAADRGESVSRLRASLGF